METSEGFHLLRQVTISRQTEQDKFSAETGRVCTIWQHSNTFQRFRFPRKWPRVWQEVWEVWKNKWHSGKRPLLGKQRHMRWHPILFGALPLMSYIGMYGPEGWGFSAGLVRNRVSSLQWVWYLHWVCFIVIHEAINKGPLQCLWQGN